ncbi:MAG TPA: carboxypeptidase regulatory-like domain-containing protein [Terriglobales bacterium]|nr:carboxypeptidase regulatory-like domain-containing protein [Terriglobales bacterium]
MKSYLCFFVVLFLSVAVSFAQTSTGALRGQVTDPSGAAISRATVVLTPATGSPVTAQTNGQGMYEFKSLPAGKYSMTVVAQGFTLYENDSVVIADQPLRLNVSMAIAVETQKVQVSSTAPTVDVTPQNNAGAITISGKELESLPDDPDELESDLQALAGPSAGPNGGQMYIDGFTAGQLPPKSSIREIRINQNPFSSEYDKLGYGRIEIFTKPGTDQLHGQVLADGNDSPFNSPNPFAGDIPPYYITQFNGTISGPLRKNASFFFDVDRRDINQVSPINAVNPNDLSNFIVSSIANPRQRTNLGPRLDWALTPNNTLTVRYQYYRDTESGNLPSQFYLATQGYSTKSTENTVQLSDTQVFGTKIVNETRFQYNRDYNAQNPVDSNPVTSVIGDFTGGGNSEGTLNDTQDNYELQNYTSLIHGNHTMKFGARFRATQATDFTTSAFNGSFLFPSISDYQAGTPSQLSITTGSPSAAIDYYDFEPYFQDDWRARPNLTLSLGLRFETQNYIHDHADWAPRLGFAWGVRGKNGTTRFVIRGGSGIFYDRFQITQMLQATHLNGTNQIAYVITNPTCYPGLDQPLTAPISSCGTPSSTVSTTYQVSPLLHAPGTLQSAISLERQVTKSATLAVTYLNSRGFDQFITINAGAPYPGTPCYPNCPTPTQNLYRYVSEANFKQNQLMVNSNARLGSRLQFAAYYSLNYANSDTSGVSSFPSNSWDISQDWGRASFDTRHRLFLMGSVGLPYLVRLSPFMIVSSGSPFNITTPYNLNGDFQYNDRPSLVSTTCPATLPNPPVYCTPFGTLDLTGATGNILPINYATGPNRFSINFRLTKTIGFGPSTKGSAGPGGGGPGGGGHGGHRGGPLFGGGGPIMMSTNSEQRYNLTFGLSVRNAFNNVNPANPSGVVGSSFFDRRNALAGFPYSPGTTANRRIDLTAVFTF